MTMDTPHDAPAHHGGLIFIEPAATAPVTADGCATLQTAFAALLRPRVATGRPLCAPPAPAKPPARSTPPTPGSTTACAPSSASPRAPMRPTSEDQLHEPGRARTRAQRPDTEGGAPWRADPLTR